mmetsp:Transcript_25825/g.39676  ORF Transcript_25825/g.39676 Transcript_25825/m.39676 type:complete len:161 (-) Transcript_25825:2860-3342(-)
MNFLCKAMNNFRKMSISKISATVVSKDNFPKFVTTTISTCVLVSYGCYCYIESLEKYSSRHRTVRREHPNELTQDEAVLRAMIENARESTWEQNLSNALHAHERFVLPGHRDNEEDPKYVQQILQRSDELMDKQQRQLKLQKHMENNEGQAAEVFSSWKR